MRFAVEPALKQIARSITAVSKTEAEWAEVESDDMFQVGAYVGGFDATEMEFTFSYTSDDGNELWFQLPLRDIEAIASGELSNVDARPAESPE